MIDLKQYLNSMYDKCIDDIFLSGRSGYWSNLSQKDPVVSNLCTQIDIENAVNKANRRIARKKKELEKNNQEIKS